MLSALDDLEYMCIGTLKKDTWILTSIDTNWMDIKDSSSTYTNLYPGSWLVDYNTGCDNSRTYVPEVRQYYCLVLLCFQHVPRRHAGLLLSAYLFFAGTTWPFQVQGIQYRNLVGISCVWDVLAWNMIALMALRNVGVGCLKWQNSVFK
jgi:hypothetical protein